MRPTTPPQLPREDGQARRTATHPVMRASAASSCPLWRRGGRATAAARSAATGAARKWIPVLMVCSLVSRVAGAHLAVTESRHVITQAPRLINATDTTLTVLVDIDWCVGCIACWEVEKSAGTGWLKSSCGPVNVTTVIPDLVPDTHYYVRAHLQLVEEHPMLNVSYSPSLEARTCLGLPKKAWYGWTEDRGTDFLKVTWRSQLTCISERYYIWWRAYEYEDDFNASESLTSKHCPTNATILNDSRTYESERKHDEMEFTYIIKDNIVPATRYAIVVTPVNWMGICGEPTIIRTASILEFSKSFMVGYLCLILVVLVLIICVVIWLKSINGSFARIVSSCTACAINTALCRKLTRDSGSSGSVVFIKDAAEVEVLQRGGQRRPLAAMQPAVQQMTHGDMRPRLMRASAQSLRSPTLHQDDSDVLSGRRTTEPRSRWMLLLMLCSLLLGVNCDLFDGSNWAVLTKPPRVINATNTTLTMMADADCEQPCFAIWQLREYNGDPFPNNIWPSAHNQKANQPTTAPPPPYEWQHVGHGLAGQQIVIPNLKPSTRYEVRALLTRDEHQMTQLHRLAFSVLASTHNVPAAEVKTCSNDEPMVNSFWSAERAEDFIKVRWRVPHLGCPSTRYILSWESYEDEDLLPSTNDDNEDSAAPPCPDNATQLTNLTLYKCIDDPSEYCYIIDDLYPHTRYIIEITAKNWLGKCGYPNSLWTATKIRYWGGVAMRHWTLIIVCLLLLLCLSPLLIILKKRLVARIAAGKGVLFTRASRVEEVHNEEIDHDTDGYLLPDPSTRVELRNVNQ